VAYKYTTGSVERGDIYNQNDAQGNTYIDWSEDAIGLVAGGELTLAVSGAVVNVSGSGTPLRVDGAISSSRALYGTDLVLKTNDSSGIATLYIEGTNGTEIIGMTGGGMNILAQGGDMHLVAGADGAINWGTDNTYWKMSLSTDGDLSLPSMSAANTKGRIHVSGSDSDNLFYTNSDSNDDVFVVCGDGKVGIGTASPQAPLHITGNLEPALLIEDGNIHLSGTHPYHHPEIQFIDNAHIGVAGLKIRYNNSNGSSYFENMFNNTNAGIFFTTREAGTADNVLSLVAGQVGIGTTTPNSTFQVSGSQAGNYTAITDDITLNETHYTVDLTDTDDATVTLPAASGVTGRTYHILTTGNGEQTLTITGSGGQFMGSNQDSGPEDSIEIDGGAQSVTLLSTGTYWFILTDNRQQGH